ncbi:hypothetical protein BB560_005000 [Smittium megazygosporum]|uniref:Uncharacterized protein n=1 Tax=Smittium megazygosporum TaxID=133381 RepID=A0A2T9Z7P1_9FUNG|nr:hypothetical protein BB560_005000 [Smittium megazygosporum]
MFGSQSSKKKVRNKTSILTLGKGKSGEKRNPLLTLPTTQNNTQFFSSTDSGDLSTEELEYFDAPFKFDQKSKSQKFKLNSLFKKKPSNPAFDRLPKPSPQPPSTSGHKNSFSRSNSTGSSSSYYHRFSENHVISEHKSTKVLVRDDSTGPKTPLGSHCTEKSCFYYNPNVLTRNISTRSSYDLKKKGHIRSTSKTLEAIEASNTTLASTRPSYPKLTVCKSCSLKFSDSGEKATSNTNNMHTPQLTNQKQRSTPQLSSINLNHMPHMSQISDKNNFMFLNHPNAVPHPNSVQTQYSNETPEPAYNINNNLNNKQLIDPISLNKSHPISGSFNTNDSKEFAKNPLTSPLARSNSHNEKDCLPNKSHSKSFSFCEFRNEDFSLQPFSIEDKGLNINFDPTPGLSLDIEKYIIPERQDGSLGHKEDSKELDYDSKKFASFPIKSGFSNIRKLNPQRKKLSLPKQKRSPTIKSPGNSKTVHFDYNVSKGSSTSTKIASPAKDYNDKLREMSDFYSRYRNIRHNEPKLYSTPLTSKSTKVTDPSTWLTKTLRSRSDSQSGFIKKYQNHDSSYEEQALQKDSSFEPEFVYAKKLGKNFKSAEFTPSNRFGRNLTVEKIDFNLLKIHSTKPKKPKKSRLLRRQSIPTLLLSHNLRNPPTESEAADCSDHESNFVLGSDPGSDLEFAVDHKHSKPSKLGDLKLNMKFSGSFYNKSPLFYNRRSVLPYFSQKTLYISSHLAKPFPAFNFSDDLSNEVYRPSSCYEFFSLCKTNSELKLFSKAKQQDKFDFSTEFNYLFGLTSDSKNPNSVSFKRKNSLKKHFKLPNAQSSGLSFKDTYLHFKGLGQLQQKCCGKSQFAEFYFNFDQSGKSTTDDLIDLISEIPNC